MPSDLLSAARFLANSLRVQSPSFEFPAGIDWPRLLTHADRHSLTPLLFSIWHEARVLDRLPPEVVERIAKAHSDNGIRNTHIRAELLEIHELLEAASVPHLVLKGWPLVERLYADPAERVLYDHDFLVPADRAQVGHRALLAAGFRPLPAKDEWVEKHLPPLWRNDGYLWDGYLFDPRYPRPVEMHVRLWEERWRGLHVTALPDPFGDAVTRSVAGVPMHTLSDESTLIHLAMHFAGHLVEREARLNQLLDLARLAQTTNDSLTWDTILVRANAARVTRFAYASLYLAHALFGSPLPPLEIWSAMERACPPRFREWLALQGEADVLTSDYRQRDRGTDYRLTFLSAQSTSEKLGVLRFALLPPAGQLAAKYHLPSPRLGYLMFPPYLVERTWQYASAFLHRPRPHRAENKS